jgi:hypothetical protein
MKRLVLSAILIMCATVLFAVQPAVGVQNTFHDLSYATGYSVKITNNAAGATYPVGTYNQLCEWCHTPHHAIGSVTSETAGEDISFQLIPLWNHETSAAAFTMYNSVNNPLSDLDGTVDATVGGGSRACLSCHDGTVAVGAVRTISHWVNTGIQYQAGASASTAGHIDLTTGLMTASAWGHVGTDLTNDHPISITYRNDLDNTLNPPAGLVGVKLFGLGGNVTGSKVECGSCHNPHNYGTAGTTAPFLRASMQASAMCKQCHNK